MWRKLIGTTVLVLVIIAGFWLLRPDHSAAPDLAKTPIKQPTQPTHPKLTDFDKQRFSLSDPASLWVIVNKRHPLNPKAYTPDDLVLPAVSQRKPGTQEMKMRAATAHALETMFAAANTANIHLTISTAYRSYSYQKTLYNGYVATSGQVSTDKRSARPGYSEHQTGLAVDIRAQNGKCSLDRCFGNLPEGKWLAGNAYRYGFWLRYPAGKEAITGYDYEPWHFRYVGTDLSLELHKQNASTLEEFFGVSGGTSYN